jgi:hypothetical protein
MATIKKACKGGLYPKSSSVSSRLGSPSRKMKSGGSLGMKSVKAGIDKNPGVTRADIIAAATKQAKYGTKMKKAQVGKTVKLKEDSRNYVTKIKTDGKGDISSMKTRRTLKGLVTGAPRAKFNMKSGGKMTKKCRYGCK